MYSGNHRAEPVREPTPIPDKKAGQARSVTSTPALTGIEVRLMSNLSVNPEPDPRVVEDVERLLRHFAGDDLSQQDAIRALGLWKRNSDLTAADRAAILDRFEPDPDQAKIVNLLGNLQGKTGGAP
jgi:phage I-like protein